MKYGLFEINGKKKVRIHTRKVFKTYEEARQYLRKKLRKEKPYYTIFNSNPMFDGEYSIARVS